MVAAQDEVSEEVVMFVGNRTGLAVEAEVGRSRKNGLIGRMGERIYSWGHSIKNSQ